MSDAPGEGGRRGVWPAGAVGERLPPERGLLVPADRGVHGPRRWPGSSACVRDAAGVLPCVSGARSDRHAIRLMNPRTKQLPSPTPGTAANRYRWTLAIGVDPDFS